jgi:hypothetical protein
MKCLFSLIALLFATHVCSAQNSSVLLMDGNGMVLGSYNSIKQAYAAIPATLTDAYRIDLQSTYTGADEALPVTFTSKPGASATNKIRITSSATFAVKWADTSDIFVLDDADWIEFDLYFTAVKHSPNRRAFHFRNGACNNTIRGFEFLSGSRATITPDAEPHILFGASPGNADGNSNNRVEKCYFGESNNIVSLGTPANPNQNNIIKGNFIRSHGTSITMGSGTSGIVIDSNTIYFSMVRRYTRGAIDLENVSGDISITRNAIILTQDSGKNAGIYINTIGANQVFIANNMIGTTEWSTRTSRKIITNADPGTDVSGIWIDGNNPTSAQIYHNTVLIKGLFGTMPYNPAATAVSTCLLRTENNAASSYDIRNNLFLNSRSGGKNGSHTALHIHRLGSVTTDHNIYNSKTGLAILDGNSYGTMAAYKAEAAKTNNNDLNSDSISVSFAGYEEMHLHNSMYGNPALYGTAISSVPVDVDNNTRTVYYRGADEYAIACPWLLPGGAIQIRELDSCRGHYSEFSFHNTVPAKDGVIYQWQMRHAGGPGPFVDIAGEQGRQFYVINMGPMDYRVKTSCMGTTQESFSDTITMITKPVPMPSVDSIRVKKGIGWNYTFYAEGAKLTTGYIWDFDENMSVFGTDTVNYNFKTSGPHKIRVIVTNNFCAYDTAYITLDIGLGITDRLPTNAIRLYPNPANDYLYTTVPEHTRYTITDLSGRTILAGNALSSGIDIRQLLSGTYIIGFTLKEQTVYTRFVKE